MVVRCILGCAPPQVLFSIPKHPSLRARWLQFLHFEEGGITANSRLCARHFTEECFKNLRRYEMGLVRILYLTETAVPSLYTVGTSTNVKVSKTNSLPLTRDVGIQFILYLSVQVKPLCPSMTCSTVDLGDNFHPLFKMSTPIKRPRMGNSADEINDTSSGTIKESTALDSTYKPDITQEDSQKYSCVHTARGRDISSSPAPFLQ
uniref:THAP domain-containing protein 1 n=1 Tax=Cyprinus carpio carpio TaxID=630221 RepID=A0A9J7X9W5_CYPCA